MFHVFKDNKDDKLIIIHLIWLLKRKKSHFCALPLEVWILDYVFDYFSRPLQFILAAKKDLLLSFPIIVL